MRILTVRQPWAWAIIHGGKDVENRVRNIAGDYRGPVAIHAGLSYDMDATICPPPLYTPIPVDEDGSHMRPLGAIIGVVDLVDVHSPATDLTRDDFCQSSMGDLCSAWAEVESWHLVLANPRALDQTIPWKGALGLRKTNLDIIGEHLVERVDTCTCGQAGVSGPHEPACGYEMVARLVATS